jgi:hypothetical protein
MTDPAPRRPRTLFRAAFWVYALTLFTFTHWPKLTVPGPEGTDKTLHVLAFAGWTGLAVLCGWFGRPLSVRNLLLTGLIAAANSAVDELLQAIPFVNRSCEWADARANLLGVAIVVTILLVLGRPLQLLFPKLLAS